MEEEHKGKPKKRPTLLRVLIVLSSINIAFTLLGVFANLTHGPLTQDDINKSLKPTKESIIALNKEAEKYNDQTLLNVVNKLYNKSKQNLEYRNFQVFYPFNVATLIGLILGAASLYFMFNYKKIGFHLYIIYSLSPIIIAYSLIPTNLILSYYIIYVVVLSAILSILYGRHLKYMD